MENNTQHKSYQWYIQFDESPLELMHETGGHVYDIVNNGGHDFTKMILPN